MPKAVFSLTSLPVITHGMELDSDHSSRYNYFNLLWHWGIMRNYGFIQSRGDIVGFGAHVDYNIGI